MTSLDSEEESSTIDPDDRRKHLEFIQAVVSRMSSASVSAKSWLLPVVTAAYGYGMTKNAWSVVALGMSAVLLFMFLDAHYLDEEKKFRALYDEVSRDSSVVPIFSMDTRPILPARRRAKPRRRARKRPTKELTADQAFEGQQDVTPLDRAPSGPKKYLDLWLPTSSVWLSWSIAPFYSPLFVVGVVLLVRVMGR